MSNVRRTQPRVRIAVYGDLTLNVIDGSSVWLQSLCQMLALSPSFDVTLLLKTPVSDATLLRPLEALKNLTIVRPFETKALPGLSKSLSPPQVCQLLSQLDAKTPFDAVILRGFRVVQRLAKEGLFPDRLWPYLTDIPQTYAELTDSAREDLDLIGSQSAMFLCQTEAFRHYLEEVVPTARGKTVLLPPMIPSLGVRAERLQERPRRTLRLVYSGKFAVDWKTLEMTELPAALRQRGQSVELHVVGDKVNHAPNDPTYPARMRKALESSPGVVWHGAMSREAAMELVSTCDIGMSWRSSQLNDSLELSTKVLEYASLGVPVLLNRNPLHEELLGADYPFYVSTADDVLECIAALANDFTPYVTAQERCISAIEGFSFANALRRIEPFLLRRKPTWTPVRQAPRKRRLLIASHDLKFFGRMMESFRSSPHLEVRVDNWTGLHPKDHNEQESRALLEWADIIFCEWCAYNAVWYADNKRPGQQLYVRFHRFEKDLAYPPKLNIDQVTRVVCVSDYYRDLVRRQFGWPADKVETIPNWVDLEQLDRPKLPGYEYHLGMLGAVPISRKRLDRAVEILRALRAKDKRYRLFVKSALPWELGWVWKKDEERSTAEDLMRDIRTNDLLREGIVFDRYSGDVSAWFRKIGITLSTSESESFHLSPCEGMASRALPMILHWEGAETIYGPQWIHESVQDIVAAIEATPKSQFRKLGEECRAFAQQFTIDRVMTAYYELMFV